jgi:3-hydroxy-5-methyl-1-naphthoate 3-O-methyltransferase
MTQSASTSDHRIIKDQIEVLSIAEGFFQSSVLFALLRLEIFERIGEGSKTLDELAAELDARPETLARLLNAGVMLKLLEVRDGSEYQLAPACRSVLLSSAGDNYLGYWIHLQDEFYSALSHLDQAILKSGPVIDPSVYLGADRNRTRQYTLAMHNYASLRGKELAHYLDTSSCQTFLDLGCGAGTYAFHLGAKNPDLRLYLSDLPEVLEVAREIQANHPINNEVHYLPLDAATDEIPGSYDMILISNMLHCFDEKARTRLIDRLYRATNPGGSLVVQAQYLKEDRLGGRWAIYVDLNLLCTTRNGRNHTVEETRGWLEKAGFTKIEYCPMSIYGANSFVRAFKAT